MTTEIRTRSLFWPRAEGTADALDRVRDLAACEQAFRVLARHLPELDSSSLCYLLATLPELGAEDPDAEPGREAVVESALAMVSVLASQPAGGVACRS